MVLTAVRGAIGFLSRLPVGHDEASWEAFSRQPAAFPVAGYVLGVLLALPLILLNPSATAAAAFLAWLYLLTGISHLDGLTDLGDALAVHGEPEKRRSVMRDTTVGVGGVLALGLVLISLALAGLWLASAATGARGLPGVASEEMAVLAVVVAAEVGAKAAMATVVCVGEATHEGLGSALTDHSGPDALPGVAAATAPMLGVALVFPVVLAALLSALGAGAIVLRVAREKLGGVSGDVLGATNEIARVVALHVGVMLWTLS